MPTYDLFCGTCGLLTVAKIPLADLDKPIYCPRCKQQGRRRQLVRVILHAPAFKIKRGKYGYENVG